MKMNTQSAAGTDLYAPHMQALAAVRHSFDAYAQAQTSRVVLLQRLSVNHVHLTV